MFRSIKCTTEKIPAAKTNFRSVRSPGPDRGARVPEKKSLQEPKPKFGVSVARLLRISRSEIFLFRSSSFFSLCVKISAPIRALDTLSWCGFLIVCHTLFIGAHLLRP